MRVIPYIFFSSVREIQVPFNDKLRMLPTMGHPNGPGGYFGVCSRYLISGGIVTSAANRRAHAVAGDSCVTMVREFIGYELCDNAFLSANELHSIRLKDLWTISIS